MILKTSKKAYLLDIRPANMLFIFHPIKTIISLRWLDMGNLVFINQILLACDFIDSFLSYL